MPINENQPIINAGIVNRPIKLSGSRADVLPENGKTVAGEVPSFAVSCAAAEYVIPSQLISNQISQALYSYVAQLDGRPDDLLERMVVLRSECFYVPCHLYEGTYQADWQVQLGYMPWVTCCGESSDDNLIWNDEQGQDHGEISVPVYTGSSLPEHAVRLLAECEVGQMPVDFDGVFPGQCHGEDKNNPADPEAVFRDNGRKQLAYAIDCQIKQRHSEGDYQRAWHWQINGIDCSVRRIWMPIGRATFRYRSRIYTFWCSGIDSAHVKCDELPIGSGQVRQMVMGWIPAGIALAAAILGFLGMGDRTTLGFVLILLVPSWLYSLFRSASIQSYRRQCRQFVDAIQSSIKTAKSCDCMAPQPRQPARPLIVSLLPYDRIVLPVLMVAVLVAALVFQMMNG